MVLLIIFVIWSFQSPEWPSSAAKRTLRYHWTGTISCWATWTQCTWITATAKSRQSTTPTWLLPPRWTTAARLTTRPATRYSSGTNCRPIPSSSEALCLGCTSCPFRFIARTTRKTWSAPSVTSLGDLCSLQKVRSALELAQENGRVLNVHITNIRELFTIMYNIGIHTILGYWVTRSNGRGLRLHKNKIIWKDRADHMNGPAKKWLVFQKSTGLSLPSLPLLHSLYPSPFKNVRKKYATNVTEMRYRRKVLQCYCCVTCSAKYQSFGSELSGHIEPNIVTW